MTHLYALLNPESGGRRAIAIDGKTLRGSNKARGSGGQNTLHLVSAWAQDARLVLRQVACDDKSNEVTAIPELIETMDLEGCTVTIDAMGCQKQIARKLHEKQADYALALKENHEKLHRQAAMLMMEADDGYDGLTGSTYRTQERTRGRDEVRTYTTVRLNVKTSHRLTPEVLAVWPGLQAIGRVVGERTIKGETTTKTRYYLLTDDDVKHFAQAVRGHWGIENSAHWVLDVTFGEDANRTSKDHGPENLAILRRLAMNLFRVNKDRNKIALKRQRKRVGWEITFVEELLNGVF